jgi:hypothetical protein
MYWYSGCFNVEVKSSLEAKNVFSNIFSSLVSRRVMRMKELRSDTIYLSVEEWLM